MKICYDNENVGWEINLGSETYRRIKQQTGVDICMMRYNGPNGLPLSVEIIESPLLLLDILWAICEPRANRKNITREQFDSRILGPKLPAFRAAFLEECQLFFRSLGKDEDAELLANAVKGLALAVDQALREQRKQLGIDQPGGPTPTTESKSSPELPESPTPDTSPSDN